MTNKVYLNGEILSKEEAFISPDDRGFNFADGVYEVIKYYKGKAFKLKEHIERLKFSLSEVRIEYNDFNNFETIFNQLLEQNGLTDSDAGVYLQITRGSHKRMHQFPGNIQPTVYASAYPFNVNFEGLRKGIKTITQEDVRWLRCNIKSIALLPNVLYFSKAKEEKADEVLFIRDGVVTEGAHSNIIGIKGNTVYTHPDSNLILSGITKKTVLEICRSNEIPVVEEGIREKDLFEMDELMVVGTGNEVTPVVQINDSVIKAGTPGRLTRFLQDKFFKQTYIEVGGGEKWWEW